MSSVLSASTAIADALHALFDPTALFDGHTRLYDLDIEDLPAGVLLLESFRGTDGLSALPVLELYCLATDSALDLADLINRQARLALSLSDGSRVYRSAYIAGAEVLAADGGLARYRLRLVPGLWFAHRTLQSRTFEAKTPLDIVEQVFAPYAPYVQWQATPDAQQAPLATQPIAYCVQYRETDYAFIRRLLTDAGLGFYFEEAPPDDASDGVLDARALHRLVVFADASQLPEDASSAHALGGKGLRFHRAASVEVQDSLHQLHTTQHALAPRVSSVLAWHDTQRQAISASNGHEGLAQFLPLATQRFTQGELATARLAQIETAQACDAQRIFAQGNVRTLRAGYRLTVSQYAPASWQAESTDASQYLSWAQRFVGINNLPKVARAAITRLFNQLADTPSTSHPALANAAPFSDTLQHLGLQDEAQIAQQRWQGTADAFDDLVDFATTHGYAHHSRLHDTNQPWCPTPWPKPLVAGPLSAVVIACEGNSALHTDRLGRVRVRFHFDRDRSAPTDDTQSLWLRVVQRVAGPHRGMQFVPRPGHAVWVGFLNGDIDCPLVIGSQYHGVGEGDASYSPASATLNADSAFSPPDTSVFAQATDQYASGQGNLSGGHSPVWHGAAAGEQGHRHAGNLLGMRSQAISGQGHNQLLFDDTDQQQAIQLASSHAESQLNLGHLIHRRDNYRGSFRGEGVELRTDAYGALRSARGWLFSTYPIRHTNQQHEPASELTGPIALIKQAQQIAALLNQTAGQHHTAQAASQIGPHRASHSHLDAKRNPLPAMLQALQGELDAKQPDLALQHATRKHTTAKANTPNQSGTVPGLTDPLIVLAAQGGIIANGQDAFFLTGETQSWLSGSHLHLASGSQWRLDADQAISLIGGLAEGEKDQGQGLSLIAAEGDLTFQAHTGQIHLAAKQALTLESASAGTTLVAAKQITIQTAGGASITIDGGVTVACPGTITVQAGKKNFVGTEKLEAKLPKWPQASFLRKSRFSFSG